MTLGIDVNQLQADAETQTENQAKNFSLADIVAKGNALEELKALADKVSAQLSNINDQIRVIETETLPEMLKAMGLSSFVLSSGARVSLYDVIGATITDDNREEAHDWLRKNGHGDIIKNNLILSFGKGEDQIAKELIKNLLDMRKKGETKFGDLVQKEQVHPQTLKAFTKAQLESGKEFPGPLFKLYTGQAVKIEVDKKRGK